VIVGYSGDHVFRYTVATPQSLGTGGFQARFGVNQDGSVVVFSGGANMWTSTLGLVDLNSYLPSIGISLMGWALTDAMGVSADGRTIVGFGTHLGRTEAWIADMHLACYPNCDASTVAPVLNVLDFTCFLQRFAAADAYANCDNSTQAPTLNVLDFTCFLQKFAAGCP